MRTLSARCVLLLTFALPVGGGAQTRWQPRVQLDNDAYNFWLQPGQRPDDEYTNGVKVSLETGSAPWWGTHFAQSGAGCAADTSARGTCLSTSVTLGQDLYTPKLDRAPYEPGWETERPYFAWLYLRGEAHVAGARSLRSTMVSLGVTGPPAGGALAQRTAHAINHRFTHAATGWETQIGFEPGFVLAHRRTGRLALGQPTGLAADFLPFAGLSLGNVLTNAEAGAAVRVGWNLSHPWDPRAWRGRPPVEAWLSLGGQGEFVARNISLDGNTANAVRRVDRTPAVTGYDVGMGLRLHGLVMSYHAITRSREYATGPKHHTFGSMTAGIDVTP